MLFGMKNWFRLLNRFWWMLLIWVVLFCVILLAEMVSWVIFSRFCGFMVVLIGYVVIVKCFLRKFVWGSVLLFFVNCVKFRS